MQASRRSLRASLRERVASEVEDAPSAPIRVFIVDDHPAVVDALSFLIDYQADMQVCGRAYTIEEALALIPTCKPDVTITDILLTDGHGLGLVQQVRSQHPDVHLVVFSMCQETAFAERAIRAGAYGYVMKSSSTSSVIEAVRAAAKGEIYVSRQIASRMMNKIVDREKRDSGFPLEALTDNEILVFEMLGHAYALRDVARCLGVNKKTVTTYQRHTQKKLGAENAARLVQHAYQWVNFGGALGWDEPELPFSASPRLVPKHRDTSDPVAAG